MDNKTIKAVMSELGSRGRGNAKRRGNSSYYSRLGKMARKKKRNQ